MQIHWKNGVIRSKLDTRNPAIEMSPACIFTMEPSCSNTDDTYRRGLFSILL